MTAHFKCCFESFLNADQLSKNIFAAPEIVFTQPDRERKALLECLSKTVVEKFIHHSFNSSVSPSGEITFMITQSIS